jgi:two-component system, OmpR family, alkaline phosphatase synthesis response regulator PhoP
VLIVEDEPQIAEALQLNLEGAGYQVFVANDGLEALRLFDTERPDIATVDLLIPNVSGFRLVELMKRPSPSGPTPVIVISALSFEEGEDAARAGADDFVSKPLEPDLLIRKIQSVLARRAAVLASATAPVNQPAA